MTIYPIIVTYNGLQWIDKCLGSLRTSTIPLNTIVIDNASTDGTADYIAANFPEVELIRSHKNLGFGKGNNIGLQKALNDNADYVFLLNQDAWMEPDTIEKLVKVHQKLQEYGILSPVHLNWDGKDLEYYFRTIIGERDCPDFIADLYTQDLKEIYNISFIHAACWLIRGDILKQTGGFNTIFPHYCEDLEYINRLKHKGYKVGITPATKIYHWGTHEALNKELSTNFYFQYYFNLVELLNPGYKLKVILPIKIKMICDKITSAIIFRKWKEVGVQMHLIWHILRNTNKIAANRKILISPIAFLNDQAAV